MNKTLDHYEAQARAALYPEFLAVCESAYIVLGNISSQWPERHTAAGQRLLSRLRDVIAAGTGRPAQDVQDDYCNRKEW